MKINENLLDLANYDPTKESKQLNIFGLCSKIEKTIFRFHYISVI